MTTCKKCGKEIEGERAIKGLCCLCDDEPLKEGEYGSEGCAG